VLAAGFSCLQTCNADFWMPLKPTLEGRSKSEILAAFEARTANDPATEFETACREVERIALLRLNDLLPR